MFRNIRFIKDIEQKGHSYSLHAHQALLTSSYQWYSDDSPFLSANRPAACEPALCREDLSLAALDHSFGSVKTSSLGLI